MKVIMLIAICISFFLCCTADNQNEMAVSANTWFKEYTKTHRIDPQKMQGPIVTKDTKGTTIFKWQYVDPDSADTVKVIVSIFKEAFREPRVEAFGSEKTWSLISATNKQ